MSFKLAGGNFLRSHTHFFVRACEMPKRKEKIDLKKALKHKFIKIQIKKITCGLEEI